jgi:hypothetical protein
LLKAAEVVAVEEIDRPSLPTTTRTWGTDGVPKLSGRTKGAPEPMSWSASARACALQGAQKSVGSSVPPGWTFRRMADSPSWGGGVVPGSAAGGTAPLPATSRISPGLSDSSRPPACQIPPPGLPVSGADGGTSATSVHRAVVTPLVPLMPTTQPRYGGASQCPPNAAYTTPFISRSPGRCRWYVGSKVAVGSLSAVPEIVTGKFGRSFPVARSIACALY